MNNSPANGDTRDVGSIPGSGGGSGNPLQYSCLENPHGYRSLAGYSPWSHKGDQHDLVTQQQLPHSRTLFSSDFSDIALRFLFTLSLVILFLFSSPGPFLLLVPTVDSSHWFCLLSIAILSMYILLGRISLKLH